MPIFWNDGAELYHYGIKGQRWGERRFQNEDGSLTEEGRRRYGIVGDARKKALEYSKYAQAERKQWQNEIKTGRQQDGVTDADRERWIKVTQRAEKYYEDLAKRFSETTVSKIDKQTIKDAKRFVNKAFYTNADYSDYEYKGKTRNYQLDGDSFDSWRKKRK